MSKQHTSRITIQPHPEFIDMQALSKLWSPWIWDQVMNISQNPKDASSLTFKWRSIAIISDGSSVLWLWNLGWMAVLPVLEMKSMIYAKFAGINAFPIALDSQDIDEMVSTIKNISINFSAIHLEDIKAPNCFLLERKLSEILNIPVLHIDQYGTAIAILAWLINASKVVQKELSNMNILINGAWAAWIAIANLLLVMWVRNISLFDSKGHISNWRNDISGEKKVILQKIGGEVQNLDFETALKRADVFIGLSVGGIVTRSHVSLMPERPIVFALSSPTPEIMPDEAFTGWAFIVWTGRADFQNQVNNMLVYPWLMLWMIEAGITEISHETMCRVAGAIAWLIKTPTKDCILPNVFDTRIIPAIVSIIH